MGSAATVVRGSTDRRAFIGQSNTGLSIGPRCVKRLHRFARSTGQRRPQYLTSASPKKTRTSKWRSYEMASERRAEIQRFHDSRIAAARGEASAGSRNHQSPQRPVRSGTASRDWRGGPPENGDGFLMPFGKYKGNPLAGVPDDYLRWVLGLDRVSKATHEAILRHLTLKCEAPPIDIEPLPAAEPASFVAGPPFDQGSYRQRAVRRNHK